MRDDMPELKLCPFCEGEGFLISDNYNGNFFVECDNCGAMGPMSSLPVNAIVLWNQRFNHDESKND